MVINILHWTGETVDLALDLIRADGDSRNWLPLKKLKELFNFAASKCNFQFEGENFDQIEGLAMGNPLASSSACQHFHGEF